ncbi:MAG: hypothetical protein ACE5PO_08750 [Candidatus Bathyarchaeia archaeon]
MKEQDSQLLRTMGEVLVREETETNPQHGCAPSQRPLEQYVRFGIVNLDKPSGPSSHEVTAWTKRILNVKHVGHGGTLDDSRCQGKSSRDGRPTSRP